MYGAKNAYCILMLGIMIFSVAVYADEPGTANASGAPALPGTARSDGVEIDNTISDGADIGRGAVPPPLPPAGRNVAQREPPKGTDKAVRPPLPGQKAAAVDAGSPKAKPPAVRENAADRMKAAAAVKERRAMVARASVAAKAKADASLSEFNAVREKLAAAKKADKGGLAAQAREKASEVLLNQIDSALARLGQMKEQGSALGNVDEAIAFFTEKKALLEGGALKQAELVALSKEVREFWARQSHRIKISVGREVSSKERGLLANAESYAAKASERIAAMKAKGKDTSLAEAGLARLNSDIAAMKAKFDSLRAIYSAGESTDRAAIRGAEKLLMSSHRRLQKDVILLRAIIKAASELESSGKVSAETSADISGSIGDAASEDADASIEGSITVGSGEGAESTGAVSGGVTNG